MADTLRQLRKQKGLTQKALGMAIGMRTGKPIGKTYAQKKIVRFETGLSRPKHEEMVAISEELGVEMSILEMSLTYPGKTGCPDIELGISDDPNTRQLLVICPFIHLDEGSSEIFEEKITSALKKGATVMIFIPYPSGLEKTESLGFSSEVQILMGYYSRVRLSIRNSLILVKLNLEPELRKRIFTYAVRTKTGNYFTPPLSKIYSLTVMVSEKPFRKVEKILHTWTKGRSAYAIEVVQTTDRVYGDAHWELWIPYFGEIVTNWITDGQIFKNDLSWQIEE